MLKPALARGELHIIGATTLDEYRRNIEKDAALERRFQPILVTEPSVEDTVQILCGLRDRYEAHHQVRFTDDAIRAAVELSDRYIADRHLPDKAIDLIDQAGARVRLRVKTPTTDLRSLEQEVERLQREKDQAVAAEHHAHASELRDQIAAATAELPRARSSGDGPRRDKAIDLIDQAGARVRLRVKTPTPDLRSLEQEVERRQREKAQAVAAEHYEQASELGDQTAAATAELQRARSGGDA